MHYILVSFSHKNTDLTTREKLSFDKNIQVEILKKLTDCDCISEAIVLSTCNRLEVIVNANNNTKSINKIFETLNHFSQINKNELEGRADIFEDEGAVKHLFSVAAALESLVVGESQIIGQLKDSYNLAKESGHCGAKISRLVEFSFRCAAEIKSVTNIGKNPVSVASAAVAQAKDALGNLSGYTAVIFGTGEMSVLTSKHLINNDVNVILVGRDLENTKKIAAEISDKVKAEPYSNITNLINSHVLFFTATGAPMALITNDMIVERDFHRYWFDLAVPRDINIKENDRITVYEVDDLKAIVKKNMSLREDETSKAFKIVGEYTNNFFKWLETLSVDPIIKELRISAQNAAKAEMDKAINKGYIPEKYEKCVSTILHNAFKAFLHKPTTAIKDIADKPEADNFINVVKKMFNIEEERVKLVSKEKKGKEH